ncbi:MAG: anhydro-N-acetylmuramic acid kinase [Marmoricola sp.]|nr:anhydro-N-acetylmuramic acid kinase [Marmoricola sp.]
MSDIEVPTLVTSRLLLRQWHEADLAPYTVICGDPVVMEYFLATSTPDESAAMVERQRALLEAGEPGLYAVQVREDHGFIGFIGLATPGFEAPFTPCVEVGWRLARHAWGHGYATEGARVALGHAFDILHLPEVVSFTSQINLRSQQVMQRIGMHTDAIDDFEHPEIPEDHPLRPHVLYRLTAAEWHAQTD